MVEVVGEHDPSRDWVTKRHEYAQAGVPEYWIVDPRKGTIVVLLLEGEAYRTYGEFGRSALATSATLAGVAVPVDAVFAAM